LLSQDETSSGQPSDERRQRKSSSEVQQVGSTKLAKPNCKPAKSKCEHIDSDDEKEMLVAREKVKVEGGTLPKSKPAKPETDQLEDDTEDDDDYDNGVAPVVRENRELSGSNESTKRAKTRRRGPTAVEKKGVVSNAMPTIKLLLILEPFRNAAPLASRQVFHASSAPAGPVITAMTARGNAPQWVSYFMYLKCYLNVACRCRSKEAEQNSGELSEGFARREYPSSGGADQKCNLPAFLEYWSGKWAYSETVCIRATTSVAKLYEPREKHVNNGRTI
jgi:hypothetical protein